MDIKQLRPKADQAVSAVSAAPALVGIIILLLKGELRASRLWSFLGLEVCWSPGTSWILVHKGRSSTWVRAYMHVPCVL
jgi:hypothetical protein